MNTAGMIGFICAFIVAFLLLWAFRRRMFNDGSIRTEYDERQQTARGVGYKYAYYTFSIYICLLIMADAADISLPVTDCVLYFTGIVLSGMVLSGYCILKDAYWGLNNNSVASNRIIAGIGIANLILGFIEISRGTMIVDGILQNSFINFEAGILIAFIGIVLLIKNRHDKEAG